ncbi:hypothetical protein BGX38DRAFT_1144521 [Terfezia claveryi]|nr:hypothetical protein BGX38DRAFT_1144521 [Terfezia claveryi]
MAPKRGRDYNYQIKDIKICPRKEIDDFQNDPKQLILFIKAFQIMSERPKNDVLSYYQIAGIHGAPENITWPPVGGPPATIKPDSPGYYCYHFGSLFLTWHRVYVLCIEQALRDIIMQLIDPDDPEYLLSNVTDSSELDKWELAAETWRLPYWDFALRRPNNHLKGEDYCCLPDLALEEVFQSSALEAKTLSYNKNPWYAYVFPGGYSGLPDVKRIPLSIQTRTVRHAPAYNKDDPENVDAWETGESDINSLKSFFQSETINWRANLIDLIQYDSYGKFTVGDESPGNDAKPNLSALHGNIHANTGGYGEKAGNMASVPAAGFDPTFFLLHCNVDRIGAMWQAANNDAWMDDENNVKELIPFRYSRSEFWTSERCRYPQNLGYTYPDLASITDQASLLARVTDLYYDAPDEDSNLNVGEYVVTAKYETHEVGPFHLDIFIKVDGKKVFVTSIVNFVSPLETGCASCQQASAEHHTATTATLISPKLRELYEQGKLRGLGRNLSDNIEQKLAESLQWKCYSLGGENADEEISSDKFKSLQVGVSRRVPEDPAHLIGGPFRTVPLRRITEGKPFGLPLGKDFQYLSTS